MQHRCSRWSQRLCRLRTKSASWSGLQRTCVEVSLPDGGDNSFCDRNLCHTREVTRFDGVHYSATGSNTRDVAQRLTNVIGMVFVVGSPGMGEKAHARSLASFAASL